MAAYKAMGFRPLEGFQLRYVYFINAAARERLTTPVLPFSIIDELGARMYRGKRPRDTSRPKRAEADDQSEQRGFDTHPDAPPCD